MFVSRTSPFQLYLVLMGVAIGYTFHEIISIANGTGRSVTGTAFFKSNTNDNDHGMVLEVQVTPESESSAIATRTTPEKLADGCYHIFLDVGANKGVHGRFLLEPNKYPGAKFARPLFDQWFGADRDNRDICVFAFEPNPRHHNRLQAVSNAYAKMGWRYHAMPYGVGDEDGNLTFYRRQDQRKEEWGFSHFPREADAIQVPVPVIRLSEWIQNHVQDRVLPEPFQTNSTAPKVVMKMDVECMEYRLIPDLFLSGVMCENLDFAFGEVHTLNPLYFPINLTSEDALVDGADAKAYFSQLIRAMHMNPSCKTKFMHGEDESYLHDGRPLPSPPATNSS